MTNSKAFVIYAVIYFVTNKMDYSYRKESMGFALAALMA